MCCMWWKKIVNAHYEVNIDTYQVLANFINYTPSVTTITFEVIDNAFNTEKANVLHMALQGKNLTSFTFVNTAMPINYQNDEFDNFQLNVAPMKDLPFTTNFLWDDVLV